MLPFPCSACGQKLRVRPELVGRKLKCPRCGHGVEAPLGPDPETCEAEHSTPNPALLNDAPTVPPAILPGDTVQEAKSLPPRQQSSLATDAPKLANYEILEELGRGGMGVVYKARQVRLKRLVALKMILAGPHAGPVEVERFRTEAEAVARLQDPNIVQIFEIGESQGLPYFALEFVGGGSPADEIA